MFRVTRAEEQAVRLIMRLAIIGEQLTLSDLAEAEDLPEPTVAKLLGMLRRGGVVEAVRGRNGQGPRARPDRAASAPDPTLGTPVSSSASCAGGRSSW